MTGGYIKASDLSVGDEVIFEGARCIVSRVDTQIMLLTEAGRWKDALCYHLSFTGKRPAKLYEMEKTGRHFPEMEILLEKMREKEE